MATPAVLGLSQLGTRVLRSSKSVASRDGFMAMLIRLLVGSAGDQSAGDVKEQVKTRLAFLGEACEGDGILLAEIQRVPDML